MPSKPLDPDVMVSLARYASEDFAALERSKRFLAEMRSFALSADYKGDDSKAVCARLAEFRKAVEAQINYRFNAFIEDHLQPKE